MKRRNFIAIATALLAWPWLKLKARTVKDMGPIRFEKKGGFFVMRVVEPGRTTAYAAVHNDCVAGDHFGYQRKPGIYFYVEQAHFDLVVKWINPLGKLVIPGWPDEPVTFRTERAEGNVTWGPRYLLEPA